jgi:hypothetical protein
MFYLILGYILGVVFPVYGLNAYIVSMWKALGAYLATKVNTTSTPATPVTPSTVAPRPSTQRIDLPE